MSFTSSTFILGFYPIILLVYWLLRHRYSASLAFSWLSLCSILLYGWWNSTHLPVLVASLVANYALGFWLSRVPGSKPRLKALSLAAGIAVNIFALGYYKYLISSWILSTRLFKPPMWQPLQTFHWEYHS